MSRAAHVADRRPDPRRSASGSFARGHSVRFKESVGPVDDAFEREADRIAQAVVRGEPLTGVPSGWSAASAAGTLQRKCADCEEEDEKIRRAPKGAIEEPSSADISEVPAASPAAAGKRGVAPRGDAEPPTRGSAASGLLVGDGAVATGGQQRKSEFLGELRAEISAAVDAALVGTGRDSQGCPWIDYWIGYYTTRDAGQVERSLRRYAPEAQAATSARDYVGIVVARVKRSVKTWAITGQITGVPDDIPGGSAMVGRASNNTGGMFFKARSDGPRLDDAVSVRTRLGGGRPLPVGVRSRMESAFGVGFGAVRLHDDAGGARISDQLNARAFTVGEHVAFGAGEFAPGTIAGDALLAHELAHVVQQGGAAASGPQAKSPDSNGELEADADRAATSAVLSLWRGGRSGIGRAAQAVLPGIRSGLRISRCSRDKSSTSSTKAAAAAKKGTWNISQSNTDGSASSDYFSVVGIKFDPEPTAVNCSKIAFVQNVRVINGAGSSIDPRANFKNRITGTGWTIDRVDQRKYGWYGYNNDGNPSGTVTPGSSPTPKVAAEMIDRPRFNAPSLTWDFETCSICKAGADAGTVYGTYTWGFDVDAARKLTSHANTEAAAPSAEFTEAIKQWNAQAAGDAAKRNDPDQQALGPFK